MTHYNGKETHLTNILNYLEKHRSMSMKKICDDLNIRPDVASSNLKQLVDSKRVTKFRHGMLTVFQLV